MMQSEKLAQLDTWIELYHQNARQLRSALGNGIPEGWRKSKPMDAYQFDVQCIEWARFGLERLREAIEKGDVK